jgi:hypothetical protein
MFSVPYNNVKPVNSPDSAEPSAPTDPLAMDLWLSALAVVVVVLLMYAYALRRQTTVDD